MADGKRDSLKGDLVDTKEVTPVEEITPSGSKYFPTISLNEDYFKNENFKVGDKGSFLLEYEVAAINDTEKEKTISFKVVGVGDVSSTDGEAPEIKDMKDRIAQKKATRSAFEGE